jgi:hypothetical protein
MKYSLSDTEIQEMSDKLKEVLEVKYKNELSDIPTHVRDTLIQNFVIQAKTNNVDIDVLLDEANISIE